MQAMGKPVVDIITRETRAKSAMDSSRSQEARWYLKQQAYEKSVHYERWK